MASSLVTASSDPGETDLLHPSHSPIQIRIVPEAPGLSHSPLACRAGRENLLTRRVQRRSDRSEIMVERNIFLKITTKCLMRVPYRRHHHLSKRRTDRQQRDGCRQRCQYLCKTMMHKSSP